LFEVERQRDRALAAAYQSAVWGHGRRVVAFAGGADAFRRGEDSRRLLALGYLLQGDFARAWQLLGNE
jgi:hypothetical protein